MPDMKTDPLNIRFSPEEREALRRAAEADDRSISAMGRKIIVEWLREKGLLAREGWLSNASIGCPWHGGPCVYGCSQDEQRDCLERQNEKLPPLSEFDAWKRAKRTDAR